jgi:hypothetical protein
MKATLNLPGDPELLTAALEGLVAVNCLLIERGEVPADPREAGVVYRKEGTGLEEWNNAMLVIQKGEGDCEDLASWEAARMRTSGEDEGARVIIIEPGRPGRYHAVVERSDGEIVDVCLELGMVSRRRRGPQSATSSRSSNVSGRSVTSMLPPRMQASQVRPRRRQGGGLLNTFLQNSPAQYPQQQYPSPPSYSQQQYEQAMAMQAMQSPDPFGTFAAEQAAEDPMEWMNPNDASASEYDDEEDL